MRAVRLSSKSRLTLATLALATVCAAVGGCSSTHLPLPQAGALFSRWFVEPTPERFDSLTHAVRDTATLARVVHEAVLSERAQPGTAAVVLRSARGEEWALGIATPRAFTGDTRYPLVVYLHGGIANATPTKGQKAFEMLGALVDSCDAFVVSPTATRAAPWWSPDGLERILASVRYMSLHYPIDPERIVLAGVSDGAAGCYAAANTIGGVFAGFIAISGHPSMATAGGMPLVPSNLMQRPIHHVHAGKDHLFALDQVNAVLDQLASQGVAITRQVYPDEQHGFDYRDREMSRIAGFVRQWRRPSERTGLSWRFVPGFPWNCDNLVSTTFTPGSVGAPGLNAYWSEKRLVVQSIGVSSFVFRAPRADSPPVVVANSSAQERSRDVSGDVSAVLAAIARSCVPSLPATALYSVTLAGKQETPR